MRLVSHVARAHGGKKGDVRQTLCGKARRLYPRGRALVGCDACLRALIQIANDGGRSRFYSEGGVTS